MRIFILYVCIQMKGTDLIAALRQLNPDLKPGQTIEDLLEMLKAQLYIDVTTPKRVLEEDQREVHIQTYIFMCVCIHLYVCVCVCEREREGGCVCVRNYMFILIFLVTDTHRTNEHGHTVAYYKNLKDLHLHLLICTHIFSYRHVCMHLFIYIHVYTYAYL